MDERHASSHVPDWAGIAQQMRLDRLAIECCNALTANGIPHAVIKGPTTSLWLYDPPRAYRDVDLLVPATRLDRAVTALIDAGVARATHGALGEEGPHSLVLTSSFGAEVDLHVTLPTLSPPETGDGVWPHLADHLEDFPLSGHVIKALDKPGRCVVLALHVIASGHESEQVREDLRRATTVMSPPERQAAYALAGALELTAEFEAGLAVAHGQSVAAVAPHVALRLSGGSSSAIQIATFATLAPRRRLAWLLRELFPSREFMHRSYPKSRGSLVKLSWAYISRAASISRSIPQALREYRKARGASEVRTSPKSPIFPNETSATPPFGRSTD